MYELRSIWFHFMSVAWVVVVIHPVVDDAVVPDGGRAKYAEEAGIVIAGPWGYCRAESHSATTRRRWCRSPRR